MPSSIPTNTHCIWTREPSSSSFKRSWALSSLCAWDILSKSKGKKMLSEGEADLVLNLSFELIEKVKLKNSILSQNNQVVFHWAGYVYLPCTPFVISKNRIQDTMKSILKLYLKFYHLSFLCITQFYHL